MGLRKTKPSGALKRLLDTKKVDTKVVGPVERMLMAKEPGADRRQDVLHPSELAKSNHCPLADYYRLVACDEGRPLPKREAHRFRSEVIFSEGHEYHRKWQEWLTELGVLEGMWLCPNCEHRWWGISPMACQRCNHVGWRTPGRVTNMTYLEVPLASETLRIAGHADGKVDTGLLEVKSIGQGTIRIEAPALYKRHTLRVGLLDEDDQLVAGLPPRQWVDMDGLWDSIRRPFPSHLRQADIYMGVARSAGSDVDHMIFVYESKAKGGSKEFVVPYNPERSDPLLETALDIVWAVEKRRPPACPYQGCDACRAYEKDVHEPAEDAPRREGAGERPLLGRARAAGPTGAAPARPARRGLAGAARRPH